MTQSLSALDRLVTPGAGLFGLDGGMGSHLEHSYGLRPSLPRWSAEALDTKDGRANTVAAHTDYIHAGADGITAISFRTGAWTYAKAGLSPSRAEHDTRLAVALAQEAVAKSQKDIVVLGSMGTLEDCYDPKLVQPKQVLDDYHGRQAEILGSTGVNAILIETVNAPDEGIAMALAAARTKKPYALSWTLEENGHLRDGTPIIKAVQAVQAAIKAENLRDPFAYLMNCCPIDSADAGFNQLRQSYGGKIGVFPNGLHTATIADDMAGTHRHNQDACPIFVKAALNWAKAGAEIVGGCCAINPADIAAFKKASENLPEFRSAAVLATGSGHQLPFLPGPQTNGVAMRPII